MDKKYEDRLAEIFAKHGIPEYMIGGMIRYVLHGIEPGGFLFNVFANDLMGAVGKADETNAECLRNYAMAIYNDCPRDCHGSPDQVLAWMKQGGLNGLTL